MHDKEFERLGRDIDFIRLAAARDRLGLWLFVVTMAMFTALLLLVAFAPQILARPVAPGSLTTIGWSVGAATIVLPWLLTLIYVYRTNRDSAAMSEIMRRAVGE